MTFRENIQHHLAAAGYGIGLAPLPNALRASGVAPLEFSDALGFALQPVPVASRSARNTGIAGHDPRRTDLTFDPRRRSI